MIAFLKANTAYAIKPGFQDTPVDVRVIVGAKEQKKMLRSAELLHVILPGSWLEIKDGQYHGEYSINLPELYVEELLQMIAQYTDSHTAVIGGGERERSEKNGRCYIHPRQGRQRG